MAEDALLCLQKHAIEASVHLAQPDGAQLWEWSVWTAYQLQPLQSMAVYCVGGCIKKYKSCWLATGLFTRLDSL